MTNKTEMVSVPRELLECIANFGEQTRTFSEVQYWARTVLFHLDDATVEDVRAVVDEPVAYVLPAQIEALKDVGWVHAFRDQGRTGTEIALYRHPQRKVVMPERMDLRSCDGSQTYETKAWNACLDEFARLNK